MTTTQFFNRTMTAESMKSLYRQLVKTHHPDLGGDTEVMKKLNAEFSYWYSRAASEEVFTRKSDENPDKDYSKYRSQEYIDSLEQMINWLFDHNVDAIEGLTVELIGVFVWISGITWEHKNERELVKSVGFQGSWKHQDDGTKVYMWKWTPEIRRFSSDPSIDNIRRNYGSELQSRKSYTPRRKQLA